VVRLSFPAAENLHITGLLHGSKRQCYSMTSSARPNSVIATVFSHNGSGTTFETVVDFYNDRFNMNLSQRDKADLVAFLTTL
jgi:hypothetical protein